MGESKEQDAKKPADAAAAAETTATETPATFDAWLGTQTDEVKAMHEDHTKGLKSALTSEREGRKDAEKQVRDLAANAEKGSEAQAELVKVADQMAEADRKAEFYEAAHGAGVSNMKLAYTAAVQDGMFDARGNANFETMKTAYPELFGGRPIAGPGDAGAGTQTPPSGGKDMNEFIRSAAGR